MGIGSGCQGSFKSGSIYLFRPGKPGHGISGQIGLAVIRKDSFIGTFTSIGTHSRVENAVIEHSVLLVRVTLS